MDPDLLRRRIVNAYQQTHGVAKEYGALTWFAEEAGVDQRSVSRWVRGERKPHPSVLKLLEYLEREAGIG